MRFKVELRKDVRYFLRRHCTDEERKEFYLQLDRVRDDPIENSEALVDPSLSRYILRFFRFGSMKIAVFEFESFRGRLDILKCRTLESGQSDPGALSGQS